MIGLRYGLLILSVLVALEHGASTFISMGDNPVAMQRFVEEAAGAAQPGRLCQIVQPWNPRRSHVCNLTDSSSALRSVTSPSCPPARRPSTSAVRTAWTPTARSSQTMSPSNRPARSTTRAPPRGSRRILGRCRAVDGVHGRGCRPQRRVRGHRPAAGRAGSATAGDYGAGRSTRRQERSSR